MAQHAHLPAPLAASAKQPRLLTEQEWLHLYKQRAQAKQSSLSAGKPTPAQQSTASTLTTAATGFQPPPNGVPLFQSPVPKHLPHQSQPQLRAVPRDPTPQLPASLTQQNLSRHNVIRALAPPAKQRSEAASKVSTVFAPNSQAGTPFAINSDKQTYTT